MSVQERSLLELTGRIWQKELAATPTSLGWTGTALLLVQLSVLGLVLPAPRSGAPLQKAFWVVVETVYCKHLSTFCMLLVFASPSASPLLALIPCSFVSFQSVFRFCPSLIGGWGYGKEERFHLRWNFIFILGTCLGLALWVARGPSVEFILVLYFWYIL